MICAAASQGTSAFSSCNDAMAGRTVLDVLGGSSLFDAFADQGGRRKELDAFALCEAPMTLGGLSSILATSGFACQNLHSIARIVLKYIKSKKPVISERHVDTSPTRSQ